MAQAKRPRLIHERAGSHRLFDDQGKLVLEVLVGTAAQYLVRMTLNEAEAAEFNEKGMKGIDELAARVAFDEPTLRTQGRTQPV